MTIEKGSGPRGTRRLLTYYDPAGLEYPLNSLVDGMPNDVGAWTSAIETLIRAHADAGVDTISQTVWDRFTHMLHPETTEASYPCYEPRPQHDEHVESQLRFHVMTKAMHEAGADVIQVMLDSCHRLDLTFIAAMRMNDRHPISLREKTYLEHPEWHLKLQQEGVYWDGGFDYSIQAVRDRVLTFLGDMLKCYDVDGVEYDWMRWVYVFPPGTESDNAPLLNEFHRQTRRLLDDAGTKRGRRLHLGVRVPHVFERCMEAGFDVNAWIKEGSIDYVVPSHFGHMDYNTRVEEFRSITEGTDCRVYPSTQGVMWTGPCRLEAYRPAHYYAAAHNFYASGADGIQTYNYQFPAMENYVSKLRELTPINDPEILAGHDREYLYWRHHGRLQAAGAGAMQYDVIHLSRSDAASSGTFEFRLAENVGAENVSAEMQFIATGMSSGDDISVTLNGKKVPPERVRRFHVWDGHDHEGTDEPYDLFRIVLSDPPVKFGDNELAVSLTNSTGDDGVIRIEDVCISVHLG